MVVVGNVRLTCGNALAYETVTPRVHGTDSTTNGEDPQFERQAVTSTRRVAAEVT